MPYPRTAQALDRILRLIAKLYRFEPITLADAAAKFEVSERTIRRDLEKIARIIPVRKEQGLWQLDTAGKRRELLGQTVLRAFAENMRIQSSYLDSRSSDPRLVAFAIRYHRLPKALGEVIIKAILENHQIAFEYKDKNGHPSHRTVDPVKLLHAQGFWYLISYDHDRQAQRNFRLDLIRALKILPKHRTLFSEKLRQIENTLDPWQSAGTSLTEVRLYADPYAANYLKENPLLPSQTLFATHQDGAMTFSYRITHPMELLPKVKSWIPHLLIEEPDELRNVLMKELREYLGKGE